MDIIDGRYRIIKEIGRGGGGVVYLCDHLSMKKQVILKEIFHSGSFANTELLRTEVDILKRLKHPALPQVYDFLKAGETYFTVMEYIPGSSLREYMRAGRRFSQEQIIRWGRELTEVAAYMHRKPQAVIHRDIKPSNIMIRPDGRLCLIDFNISDDTAKSVSQNGYSAGYASPEQIEKGKRIERRMPSGHIIIDERTDIYGIGAVLYHLLCGRPPGEGRPTLTEQNCCFYPLAKIVDKCLRKKKEERYSSAEALLYDLNHLEKTDNAYIRYTWYGRAAAAGSVFLFALGILLIIFGLTRNQQDAYYEAYHTYVEAAKEDKENVESQALAILNNRGWSSFLERNPEEKEKIFYQLGAYYNKKENYEKAQYYFSKALATGEASDECYRDYAISCVAAGNTERAEYILTKAWEAGVERKQLLLVEGELACAREDYEQARECFDESRKSGTKEQKAKADSLYAKVCILLEEYEAAGEVLETKTEHDFSDWMNLAFVYQKTGREDQAEDTLLRAGELYPKEYGVYVRLALLEYEKQDRQPQALKDYTKMKEYYGEACSLKDEKETSQEWEQLVELMSELTKKGWM